MPPTVMSAVDSQKTWFRSPLMTFHQNFIPRRRMGGCMTIPGTGSLPMPMSGHQQQHQPAPNDHSRSPDDVGKTIYSKLATDKEGVPLFCAKGFLPEKPQMKSVPPPVCAKSYLPEKQQTRVVTHDHRNCWPSKNYRCSGGNDNSSSGARNRDHDVSSSSAAANKTNVTISEECFLNTENCLPRIIKPRKRRKKDRKPGATTNPSTSSTTTSSAAPATLCAVNQRTPFNGNRRSTTELGAVNRWCREGQQACGDDVHKPLSPSKNILLGMRVALCRPNSKSKASPTAASEGSDCNSSVISRSLINILSESNGQNAAAPSLSTTAEELCDDLTVDSVLEGTTSVCRCKYCDPESVVWDVSQRCFSPNLMPPVGQTFAPPQLKPPSEKSSSPGATSKLNYTTLKRSSSEPTSKPFTNPVVARVRSFSGSCDKGSQNLLVSSQIVTSHDGHRDIEVKFFSLSADAPSTSS